MPLGLLFALLILMIVLSALFSSSETGLMTVNRYRMRHHAKAGRRGAIVAERLLQRPDRIIGLILIGNNLVNIAASMLTTIIALRLWGEYSLFAAGLLLTLVILIFAEVGPKTVAALYPERLAYPAARVYWPLLRITYPIVWSVNLLASGFLRLMRIKVETAEYQALSAEELRTVVLEAGAMIPKRHQRMLLSILDLQKATVEDIMIPRNEIVGIDLNEDWKDVLDAIINSQHTRVPIYEDSIDNLIGVIHLRRLLSKLKRDELDKQTLIAMAREGYFIPEGTPLNVQLLNFQRLRRRVGFVVDEYGDIQGLVALEDILEEIVGEFTTDPAAASPEFRPEPDGSFTVNAGATIRAINRGLAWDLPTSGPRTLNGLIVEYMEAIPEAGTSLKLGDYQVEILKTHGRAVQTVRITPPRSRKPPTND
ncbi:MAG: HlyC/CorC family transporter [Pseudomonadota bacterium]|nr:HlyC/CorC family transporter [Pseudomonadota bacterium]